MSVLSDELMKLVDRLLVDAFTAGANGDDFDMLAANRAVAEAALAADRAARPEPIVESCPGCEMGGMFHMPNCKRVARPNGRHVRSAPPAAPVVPEGYAVVHAAELLAELRKILGVDGTVYQRVRAMLAATPAPSQEPTT